MENNDINKFVVAFEEQGWSKPPELFEDYFYHQETNKLKVFVAQFNNEIAGYVTLFPNAPSGLIKTKMSQKSLT